MRLAALLLLVSATASPLHAQWSETAEEHRGEDVWVIYDCPPGGTAHTIYGTDLYTDDSSVCTAAVHAGLITLDAGGRVTVQMTGGAEAFEGTTRNGIESESWGEWPSAFYFHGGDGLDGIDATWSTTPQAYRGQIGTVLTYGCPAGGSIGNVWGSGIYSDDSSVCTAAVHAGAISLESGGEVTIEVLPGQDAYVGSAQNGIESGAWGPWPGSFRVVD